MSVPSGRLQFFALEAGDYLERLAMIVGRPTSPAPDDLIRLTRALRGSSLMAGLTSYSQAAGALEQVAKAYRAGQWGWAPAKTELVADAIEELKLLARRADDWSDTENATANRLCATLLSALGREGVVPAEAEARSLTDDLQPSVRTFVGREGALIAGTIEHAAQALELGQAASTAGVVLQRTQPLRGLASLPHLSPLPEFLDAIELTMVAVRDGAPPRSAPATLRRVAAAVTRIAREIAERGQTTADAPELVAAAQALLSSFAREDDVVDIKTLFAAGDTSPIITRGSVPRREAPSEEAIELVSLGDRFRQAADQLTTTVSLSGRLLQLYTLVSQLRPLAREATVDRPTLAPLLQAVIRTIGSGRAEAAPARFADVLRDAADRVAGATESRSAIVLREDLDEVIRAIALEGVVPADLGALDHSQSTMPVVSVEPEPSVAVAPTAPTISPEPAAPPRPATIELPDPGERVADEPVPIESLLADEPVPIESLLYDEPVFDEPVLDEPVPIESLLLDEPVPIESLAPPVSFDGPTVFERSFSTLHHLLQIRPTPEVEPAVPIESLLYRGRRALERADVVRMELTGALEAQLAFHEIQPLVSELIDLVPLALAE